MNVRATVVLVIAASQAAWAADPSWTTRFDFRDKTMGQNVIGPYAISAEAQVLVFRREAATAAGGAGPFRDELVYADLSSGQERAVLPVHHLGSARLAVSDDGRTVAVFHSLGGADWQPYVVSIWRPLDLPEGLQDIGVDAYNLPRTRERNATMEGLPFGDPVFSPDGGRLAFPGQYHWWASERNEDGYVDAVGIVDLKAAKCSAILLPFSTDAKSVHLWYLAWTADGAAVWVVAHGDYQHGSLEKPRDSGNLLVPVQGLPSDWTLFRCSVTESTATSVSAVPRSVLGVDADGSLIVSDVDREREKQGPFWWHRTAFGRIPIEDLRGRSATVRDAAGVAALEASTSKVAPMAGKGFRLEKVVVGTKHVYVVGWLGKGRVVLEEAPARPQEQ